MMDDSKVKQPSPAPPTVEILEEVPLKIDRPLTLLKGRAYAAAWLYIRVTTTEKLGADGKVVKLRKPKIENKRKLTIIRDDGEIFDGEQRLEGTQSNILGIDVDLPVVPPEDKIWSSKGAKEYMQGYRPTPSKVFDSIIEVIDRFIDFDHSLGDQKTMAEMIACYIMATWFLDAFNVIGFLWPNGAKGSGKTQLLVIISELAYLGQLILLGGSYASLRDMADYGATLAFDDAENLSDPKRTDPDKRSLLLAGNRRGNTVPVKEPVAKRGWRIRYVNTFCPRVFSAIGLPDPTLASRTITIPLIRTPDKYRANADPSDHDLWPCDKGELVDDLWALGLTHLSELSQHERLVNERARLNGRNLEPWRAILAVALWLEDNGCPGLWEKMEQLSWRYHTEEQPGLQTADLTYLTIRALLNCAISANKANGAINTEWFFPTSLITQKVKKVAEDNEVDIDTSNITTRKVGRTLGTMRFETARPIGSKGRGWKVKNSELERWCQSYGISFPGDLKENLTHAESSEDSNLDNGTNGIDGTNGTYLISMDDYLDGIKGPDPTKPCYACGRMAWQERPEKVGGGFYCSVCHPPG